MSVTTGQSMKRLFLILGFFCLAPAAEASGRYITYILRAFYRPQEISAWKVATSQIATAEKQIIAVDTALAQGSLASRAQLSATTDLLHRTQQYGIFSGQGAQVCLAVGQRKDVANAGDRANVAQKAYMRDNGDGRGRFTPTEYELERAREQLKRYCSAEEHNLGLCQSSFDAMAGVGGDYQKLARNEQLTTKQAEAAKDFIATAVPAAIPVRAERNCGPACVRATEQLRYLSALSSMAALPMANQMSRRTGVKTNLKDGN
ncbi:MAG: hypothetical protein JNM52_00290 [Betaproteobacteria bacterium]|nr:hypothetical protein [Betaproteobacteria bacterium]